MEKGQFPAVSLPAPPFFENLLSICYQVCMLREEERPVILRVLLAGPDLFSNRENPPMELHRLVFTHPRPCNEFELKKLSPAVDFSRSLVGVTLNQEGVLVAENWLLTPQENFNALGNLPGLVPIPIPVTNPTAFSQAGSPPP